MNKSDYICEKCSFIIEVTKVSAVDNFPEKAECPFCKTMSARRIWNNHINIPQSFKAV